MPPKPPVPIVSLSPLLPATRKILERHKPTAAWHELPTEEEDGDPIAFLETLELRLPAGPVVALLQDEDPPPHLVALLGILGRKDRPVYLVLEQGFRFEGKSRHLAFPLPYGILLQGSVLLDSPRLMARLPGGATIQALFETRARLLAYLLTDLCAALSYARTSRIRKRLSADLSWEGSWPTQAPPGQDLLGLIRLRDGQFPAVAVVHRGTETASHQRLRERLKRTGNPCAWPQPGNPDRVGAFFRV